MKKILLTKHNRGFTLLFSVIVSSLVLAVGLSIANITQKQLILSSTGRDSQIAFYAADSGAECALYYDLTHGVFPTSTNNLLGSTDIECGTSAVDDADSRGNGVDSATTTFSVDYGTQCAFVTVAKHNEKTVILSRGYNTCDFNSNRRLERGLEISY